MLGIQFGVVTQIHSNPALFTDAAYEFQLSFFTNEPF